MIRIQDLANYNRTLTLPNGETIQFEGHFANVAEEFMAWFLHQGGQFQVVGQSSEAVVEPTPVGQEVPEQPEVTPEPQPEAVEEPVATDQPATAEAPVVPSEEATPEPAIEPSENAQPVESVESA